MFSNLKLKTTWARQEFKVEEQVLLRTAEKKQNSGSAVT